MEIYMVFSGLGMLLIIAGGLILLVKAFQVHVGWGIAMLLIPIVGLVFVVKHWEKAKWPFAANMLGVALFLLAVYLQPNA